MPSAAGIIVATGAMTLANEFLQSQAPVDPTAPVASRVNWKIIPATAIAAAIFYGLEQVNAPVAKGLAYLTFATAFLGPILPSGQQATTKSPLGTLLTTLNINVKDQYGIPYGFLKGEGSTTITGPSGNQQYYPGPYPPDTTVYH